MSLVAVPLDKAYRLLNHGPLTLVTTADAAGRRNVMAASWAMPLDFSPPKVAVVIDKSTYSRELLAANPQFVLNLPGRDLAAAALAVGSCCGREGDKFARHGLRTQPASLVLPPLLSDCLACLECRVLPEEAQQQKYDLFLAEVVAAWADPAVFHDGRWDFADPQRRTLHYQAGGAFFVTGDSFVVPGGED
ncbi:MAG: hypothetical protein RIR00_2215 [Pseudomonadota bacterium]